MANSRSDDSFLQIFYSLDFFSYFLHLLKKCKHIVTWVFIFLSYMFICQQFWLEKYEQNFSPDGATIDSLEFGAGRKPICHPHEPKNKLISRYI